MATMSITMRIDTEVKAAIQELMANLGMDMSTYFTLAAKQAVREQGIPFAITMDTPNKEALEAIREVQAMKKDKSIGKAYTDVDSMMEDLLS